MKMKIGYLIVFTYAYSSIFCTEIPHMRGVWASIKDKIVGVMGLASLLNQPTHQVLAKESDNEQLNANATACSTVICGNLVVTGTISGYQAPPTISGCANLKIVHGTFTTPDKNADPVILSCSGSCANNCNWSVIRTGPPSSTSQWTVTFNPAFLSTPSVVAVPAKTGGGGQVTVDFVSTASAVFDTNASPDAIHFIAISCCG